MTVRDFIPDGSQMTEAERARYQATNQGSQVLGNVRKDFVPGPGHILKKGSGRQGQANEALERALAAQASAAREMYQDAEKKLQGLNVTQAIELITQAPFSIQELYLVVETLQGGRKGIIGYFPPVDPGAVAHWAEIVGGAPASPSKGQEQASVGDGTSIAADAEKE